MAIEITSNGTTKQYRCYPLDSIYVNKTRVKEVWANGVKYYPDLLANFRINLKFAGSSHWFDKSDIAPPSRILIDRNYYSSFLNVDSSQWIYSEFSVSTYNPPLNTYKGVISYNIYKNVNFPNNFRSDGSTQKFVFEFYGSDMDGYVNRSYHISNGTEIDILGNYVEIYNYGVSNSVIYTEYYLHNASDLATIASNIRLSHSSAETPHVSTILNANRSYEFYVLDAVSPTTPRLVAKYNGGLTVYEGDINAINVSAAGEASELLAHVNRSVIPTYTQH